MLTSDLDFHLPPDLIAQEPTAQRAESRLLHFNRASRSISHRTFRDLPSLLHPGDLLVFNDARVTPARFYLRKDTGGIVEGLFLGELGFSPSNGRVWSVLLKNVGSTHSGRSYTLDSSPPIPVDLLGGGEGGLFRIAVHTQEETFSLLDRIGRMPLPPYIHRDKHHDQRDDADRDRYQTVYARVPGSVAAPTAGLHFTPDILTELQQRGIQKTFVTLHVGLGTFRPVTADTIEEHNMHVEAYTLPGDACQAINEAKRENRRIIAVGTTAARVLESQPPGELTPHSAETGICIFPPYTWKHVNALITNFHLPRSTLIALVAAFVGLDNQRSIYSEAISHRYRFFSYGDSSFLE
jgi:S-adenosylmethionine:tRNA ribosyltransferase-isomerase